MADTATLRKMPRGRKYVGTVMSNFDHEIDRGVATRLRRGGYADYPGWEFYGQAVWFKDGQFHCEVWRYGFHIDTVSADNLPDLMAAVSEQFGDD